MKITPINSFSIQKINNFDKKVNSSKSFNSIGYNPVAYPANYYLSFGARVDKGLNRFYEQNKDVMPLTVKSYIESLSVEEKQVVTPLQAQANAFEFLKICDSVDDVKDIYENEPLFANLKRATDTRATRGLLYDVRLMNDDIKADGDSIVKGEDDLTLYLLKKVYLESKTISEINDDLDNDLNPIFKNDEKNYVSSSTLSALGIKFPQNEYLTSLRYTREGYSDKIGQTISDRWASLSDDEKMERINALLSAPKNLSPEKAKQLSQKRSQIMKERWARFSSSEKVDLIEKMHNGNKEEQIAMINAWNNCSDVREKLSNHFLNANYHNVGNIIYFDKSLSNSMHTLMTEFWDNNPDCAEKLGEAIRKSYSELEQAKNNNSFEEFASSVLEKRKNIKQMLNSKKIEKKEALVQKRKAMEDFKRVYSSMFYFLPKDYLNTYFESLDELPDDLIQIWTKKYSGQKLTPDEQKKYSNQLGIKIENKDFKRKSEAVRFAMIKVMQKTLVQNSPLINSPDLYLADYRTLSSVFLHVLKDNSSAVIEINGQIYPLNFYRKPKVKEINEQYKKLMSNISSKNAKLLFDAIVVDCDMSPEQEQKLKEYIASLPYYYSEIFSNNVCTKYKDELLQSIVDDFPQINNLADTYRNVLLCEELIATKKLLFESDVDILSALSEIKLDLLKYGYSEKQVHDMLLWLNSQQ